MEIFVTDFARSKRVVIDNYSSFTLETRYNELGSFELNIPKNELINFPDMAVVECNENLDFQCYVNNVEANTENENGIVTVKGLPLSYLLSDRIYPSRYTFTNVSLQTFINAVLTNAINNSTAGRNLNVTVNYSSDTLRTKSVEYAGEYENAYDILSKLCIKYDIGFNLKFSSDSKLVLYMYDGNDLTNEVVLSRDRNTALNSLYIRSSIVEKNFFYVIGENDLVLTLDKGNKVGVERKEYTLNFSGVSKTVNNVVMSDAAYRSLLLSMAEKESSNYRLVESLDVEPNNKRLVYGKDYNIGDIITSDEQDFNVRITKRVVGVTQIWSEEGYYSSIILGTQKGLIRY